MSIHRPKRANPRRAEAAGSAKNSSQTATQKVPKWKDAVSDKPDSAFTTYDQATTFARDDLVAHAKFGKGVVLEVEGNKVTILFEEGPKKLMHSTPG